MAWPSKPRNVHVLPEREHEQHTRSRHCPCRPAVETWTIEGRTQTRVVHRDLEQPPEADGPRAEQVQPPSPERAGVEVPS